MTSYLAAIVVLLLATIALVVSWYRKLSRVPIAALRGELVELDSTILKRLTDPKEEVFLRAYLTRQEYVHIRRQRIRASLRLLVLAGRNAAIISKIGAQVSITQEQGTAAAGRQLVATAFLFRLWLLPNLAQLLIFLVFPSLPRDFSDVWSRYEELIRAVRVLDRPFPHGAAL